MMHLKLDDAPLNFSTTLAIVETKQTDPTEKTSRTAVEIFGDVYRNVQKKEIQDKHNTIRNFRTLCPIFLMAIAYPLLFGCRVTHVVPRECRDENIFAQIFSVLIGVMGTGGSLIFRFVSHNNEIKIIEAFDSITTFSNALEVFKSNPKEEYIKQLFESIEKIKYLSTFEFINYDNNKEWLYFLDTAKLFLMDEIAVALPDSELAKAWQVPLELARKSNYCEPWKRLGIENCSTEIYEEYLYRKEHFPHIDITYKIIETFKEKVNLFLAKP